LNLRGLAPSGSRGYLQLQGISERWLKRIKGIVLNFLETNDYCISESNTIAYLRQLQESHDVSGYKKMFYQIRRFLQFIGADFANNLKAPKVRNKNNIHIWRCEDIRKAYEILKQFGKRYTAALLLAATSGIRAEEFNA